MKKKKAFSLIQYNVAAHRYIKFSEATRVSEMFNINVPYWYMKQAWCVKVQKEEIV